MRLTTRGHYAVTAMLDLAIHSRRNRLVCLADVAKRRDIPLSYLEQLFAKLRKENLVEGVRGPKGGYCIAQPLEDISVADIMISVDEDIKAMRCQAESGCNNGKEGNCISHDLWNGLYNVINQYLSDQVLSGLVQQITSQPTQDNAIKMLRHE